MLLLYIFLLSCCFSGSMGSAIREFKAKFQELVDLAIKEQALVDPAKKEIFLLVPAKKFQCNFVPCQLQSTIQHLKVHFKSGQERTYVSLMEKNVDCIISTLNKAHTEPQRGGSCPMAEMSLLNAPKRYENFFEKLEEKC